MAKERKRRQHGTGSVYPRESDGRWIGTIEAGLNANGTRRRITVSARTEVQAKQKLRDKRKQLERGEVGVSSRTTVQTWAKKWLTIKERTLSPNGYQAAAGPINKWIIPTIGRKRLEDVSPADLRAVADAQRAASLKSSTAAATHRTMLNMLRDAVVEGHAVPQRVLLAPAPKAAPSDRLDIPLDQILAILSVASTLPHGTRWAITALYGIRQGEALGLTWEQVDLDAGELTIKWQLDTPPYREKRNPASGFRLPDGYDARHLVDSFHLVPTKSKQGLRVIPLTPGLVDALRTWRDVEPPGPHDLVWAGRDGRPRDDKVDRAEWRGLQGAAAIEADMPIGHPSRRYWYMHECRNLAATMLGEKQVDPEVIKSLLGHATAAMSGQYRRIHAGPKRDAIELVARELGID